MDPRHEENIRLPLGTRGEVQVYLSHGEAVQPKAVIYVHGLGSTRLGEKSQALEHACARRGWTYASFDFRGHGESTGTMLELKGSGLLEDLEIVQQELSRRGVRFIYPVGSSMGGWAAAWFTLRQPQVVPACAVIAPALDFVRSRWTSMGEQERHHWKTTGKLRLQNEWIDTEIGYALVEEIDQFPVEHLAASWQRPLLIFHGMQDDTVPHANSLCFAEHVPAAHVELRLYKTGDHRLLAWKDEMAEAACAFFEKWGSNPL